MYLGDPGLAVNDLPAPGVCGSSLDNLTTDDDEIKITDYPWMVLIEFTKRNEIHTSKTE